jgi:cell division protein FtsB
MARRKGLSSLSLAQVFAFIGVILAGYFVVGFGRVALVGHEVRSTKADLQAEVDKLAGEVAALEDRKAYVQTDEYIEKAAREEYKLSRPGDQVIVPMYEADNADNADGLVPPAEPTQLQMQESVEPWQAWWDLFFGP